MKSKILLSLLLITILPFTAYAVGTNTPGPEEETNENNVEMAESVGPYKILTPTAADAGHIATTAYVKGAYNAAIKAINKEDLELMGQKEFDVVVQATNGGFLSRNIYNTIIVFEIDGGEHIGSKETYRREYF